MSQPDIHAQRYEDGKPKLRRYHQARWDEPVIFELSQPGQRGLLTPQVEWEVKQEVGDALSTLPDKMRRKLPPALPEVSQVHVLRHYLRLSQENLGAGLVPDLGMATSTMKYNPPVNEQLARSPKMTDLHPLQDEGTVQGILEVIYRFEQILQELSGMARFSFQPRAGSQAIYTNASIVRAYHAARGQSVRRGGFADAGAGRAACVELRQRRGLRCLLFHWLRLLAASPSFGLQRLEWRSCEWHGSGGQLLY